MTYRGARELRDLLACQAEGVARYLFPEGTKHGNQI